MKTQGICRLPFTHVRVDDAGNVGFCQHQISNNDHPFVFIGNVFHHSFDEIWFGTIAQDCRNELVQGRYSRICKMETCPFWSAKIKTSQTIGYGELPQYLELSGDAEQFPLIVEKLEKIMPDLTLANFDCPTHNLTTTRFIPANVPLGINLYWSRLHAVDLVNILALPLDQYRLIQPTKNRLDTLFKVPRKTIIHYTFNQSEFDILPNILNTFMAYPIHSFELDIDYKEVTLENCGLFKRAELIIRNHLDFKKCSYSIIRPFDLNLSKRFI